MQSAVASGLVAPEYIPNLFLCFVDQPYRISVLTFRKNDKYSQVHVLLKPTFSRQISFYFIIYLALYFLTKTASAAQLLNW